MKIEEDECYDWIKDDLIGLGEVNWLDWRGAILAVC